MILSITLGDFLKMGGREGGSNGIPEIIKQDMGSKIKR